MFEEDRISNKTEVENQEIKEALIDYAESNYGVASEKADSFIRQLEDFDFLTTASQNLFDIIDLIYSAILTNSEEEKIFTARLKKFLFNSKKCEPIFFEMRLYLINHYKKLSIEDNFTINNLLYNQRISIIKNELNNYKLVIDSVNQLD